MLCPPLANGSLDMRRLVSRPSPFAIRNLQSKATSRQACERPGNLLGASQPRKLSGSPASEITSASSMSIHRANRPYVTRWPSSDPRRSSCAAEAATGRLGIGTTVSAGAFGPILRSRSIYSVTGSWSHRPRLAGKADTSLSQARWPISRTCPQCAALWLRIQHRALPKQTPTVSTLANAMTRCGVPAWPRQSRAGQWRS